MLDPSHNRNIAISIYSDQQLPDQFIDRLNNNANEVIYHHRAIKQLSQGQADTISVMVANTLDGLDANVIKNLNCLVLISPETLAIPITSTYSKAIVYKLAEKENLEAALAIIFNTLIKSYTANSIFLDTCDIQQALAFRGGRFLNIYHYKVDSFAQLSAAESFLAQLKQNDSIKALLNSQDESAKNISLFMNSLSDLLPKNFEGDIYLGSVGTEKSGSACRDFYILHACA